MNSLNGILEGFFNHGFDYYDYNLLEILSHLHYLAQFTWTTQVDLNTSHFYHP